MLRQADELSVFCEQLMASDWKTPSAQRSGVDYDCLQAVIRGARNNADAVSSGGDAGK